jgi:hypothetical protein
MFTLITFGVMCVAALVVATFAREQRGFAVFAGSVILLNWALFVTPWVCNELSLAHLLKLVGAPATHEDMWALTDLLSMTALVVVGRNIWWSAILWSVYFAMLAMHAVAYINDLQYVEYKGVLNAGLIVQLAVLFVVGGDGCADYLSRCWRVYIMGIPSRLSHSDNYVVEAPR